MNVSLPDRDDIRRVLVIKWSALGDVAIASAIMEDIRRAFPAATIDLNTLPSAARLFAHDPRFQEIFTIDVREPGKRWRRNIQWLRRVRSANYDLVIDLQRNHHTRILLAILLFTGCRIQHRLGPYGGFPYTIRPGKSDPVSHALVAMRPMLAAAGIPARTQRPMLYASVAELEQARRTLAKHGLRSGNFAVFLPGSQAEGWLKRWGAPRYATLGKLLRARGIDKIAVIGGPEEVEECARIVDSINADGSSAAVNLNGLSLLQIAPTCAGAVCIVANDTGTAHIAAAADRPMLVICGLSDPRRVKPIGAKVRAVQAQLDCINCYGKTCRIAALPVCMAMITPECVVHLLMGTEPGTRCRGVRVFD